MEIKKVKAGVYKVTTSKETLMVRGGINFNPDSDYFRNGGFEVWSASSNEECSDENCWACGAPSKKIALEWIEKYELSN